MQRRVRELVIATVVFFFANAVFGLELLMTRNISQINEPVSGQPASKQLPLMRYLNHMGEHDKLNAESAQFKSSCDRQDSLTLCLAIDASLRDWVQSLNLENITLVIDPES